MLTPIEYEFRINQAEPVAGPHSSIPTPGNLSTAPGDAPPEGRASPPAAVTGASTFNQCRQKRYPGSSRIWSTKSIMGILRAVILTGSVVGSRAESAIRAAREGSKVTFCDLVLLLVHAW